jgi:precorrin-8X/cobalt-precorrin-8 methylmutase
MDYIVKPHEIEEKSMEIINGLIGTLEIPPAEQAIVKRIVHTTGDPEYAKLVKIHPKATEAAFQAIKNGGDIFTDVRMVLTGINKKKLAVFGGIVHCAIDDPVVADAAAISGETRAITAMKHFGEKIHGSIVAIGNAPTALFQLLKMVDAGIKPALIVGTPVGFVGAKESKELLETYDIPFVTVTGYKGGSAVAAATINALLFQL